MPEFRADHNWRKPKPGMILQAAADFDLDLNLSWMIGDSWRDVAAGSAAGCRTILLTDPERAGSGDADPGSAGGGGATPHYRVKTLADAARIIAREGGHGPDMPATTEPEPPVQQVETPPLTTPEPVKPPPTFVPSAAATVKTAQVVVPIPAPFPPAQASEIKPATVPSPSVSPAAAAPPAGDIARVAHHLDELVVQLRQQNRNAELRPDFSFSNMATLVAQGFGLVFLILGIGKYFTMKVSYATAQDVQFALMAHLQAIYWVVAAVFMQGIVIALLIYNRGK